MKKRIFIGIFLVFSLVIISCNLHKKNLKIDDNNILGIYLNNELQTSIPKKGEAVFSKAVCDNNEVNYYWDIDNWGLYVNNLSNKMKCNLYFVNYSGQTVFDFDYTGGEQTFTAPFSGTYRLETWGAQGGSYENVTGGYGGFSAGNITLSTNDKLYINIGGTTNDYNGGYNGGGNGSNEAVSNDYIEMINKYLGGGGATHIAIISGLLEKLEKYKDDILIVSGGGGGIYNYSYQAGYYISAGAAGGFIGNSGNAYIENKCNPIADIPATGGSQTSGGFGNNGNINYSGSFGRGGSGNNASLGLGTGGGSGYYGGGGTYNVSCSAESGGGGSSYIGNSLLKDKVMYCYNCKESNEENTKTISTTCNEETPTSNCSKKGNGYARITLVSIDS